MAEKYEVKGKLGTGERFQRLKNTLASRRGKKKVTNPGGLAAWSGRRKYGAKKMAEMSAAGRKKG